MKNILIFGATSVIAQECARRWGQTPCNFTLVGRNPEAVSAVAKDLEVRGNQASTFITDLSSIEGLRDFTAKLFQRPDKFDIVLMVHGVLGKQVEDQTDSSRVAEIINANFVSLAVLLTEVAARLDSGSTIAVITSVAGDRGRQSNYIYGSAKGGLGMFLEGLRGQLYPRNIHVLDIRPGFVDTPMTKDFKKGPLWASPQKVAGDIVAAVDKKKLILYTPWFWRWIMLIIKSVPPSIMRKLKI